MTPDEFNNICKEYDAAPDNFFWGEDHPIFCLAQENDSLKSRLPKLWAHNNNLKIALERAITGLDWYRNAHPEDESQVDDEFRDICNELLQADHETSSQPDIQISNDKQINRFAYDNQGNLICPHCKKLTNKVYAECKNLNCWSCGKPMTTEPINDN